MPKLSASPVTLGILGAASIAPTAFILPARSVSGVRLVGIAARDPARAGAFAKRYKIPNIYQTYDDLLADPAIEAIYNPLPNSLHAEWTIRALRAGKHVLCEKPMAANAQEAEVMAATAAETGTVLSEALAYRHHPLTARVREILASGELGRIRHIEAQFCFLRYGRNDIRYRYDLAGGATMDAGCYPLSFMRYCLGAEPTVVQAQARTFSPEIDRWMGADLVFPGGCTGKMECAMLSRVIFRSRATIRGDAGELRVLNPYQPHWFHCLTVRNSEGVRRERLSGTNPYVYQLDAFSRAIRQGTPLNTNPQDTIGTMRVIDAIYEKAGLHRRNSQTESA